MSSGTSPLVGSPSLPLRVAASNGDLARRVFPLVAHGVVVAILVAYWSVTPFCQPRPLVDLPRIDHAIVGVPPDASAIDVAVRSNGQLLLGRERVSREELRSTLEEIRRRKEYSVALFADRHCSYSQVLQVIQLVREIGVARIELEVVEEEMPLMWPLGPSWAELAARDQRAKS